MIKKYLLSLLVLLLLIFIKTIILLNIELQDNIRKLSVKSENILSIESKKIYFTLKDIRSDLQYLSEKINSQSLKDIDKDLISFSTQKKRYDQIRFIDINGYEKIRIDYNNAKPNKVADEKLQNKKSRYYFSNSIKLDKNAIYISPLDLNIEKGSIEVPVKPMIRFATPVFNVNNEKTGIVILNYLANEILSKIKNVNNNFIGDISLINSDGHYLLAKDSSIEWGFMFPQKDNTTFNTNNKIVWNYIQSKKSGNINHHDETYFFTTININDTLEENTKIVCDSCQWKMLIHIPKAHFNKELISSLSNKAPYIFFITILFSILLWIFMKNHHQKKNNEQEILYLSKQIADERDMFVAGPTMMFRLKNAYGWPVEYVSENVKTILGYEADEFLKGNLNYASIIHPESIEKYSETVAIAKKDQKKRFEHEPYKVTHKNGDHVWLSDAVSVIRDENDNVTHLYGHVIDITDLKNAQKAIEDNNKYISKVLDTIADPTVVIDVNTYEVILYNKSAKDLYLGQGNIPSSIKCYQLSHSSDSPCEGANDPCPINEILTTKKKTKVTHKHYKNNGSEIYVELIAIPIFDEEGNVIQIIESHRDITHYLDKESSLKRLASMDKLTQTYNRTKFDEILEHYFSEAQNNLGYFGLIMFDIDHFKSVNDTYGHDVGDSVLIEISSLVKEKIRVDDILVRWGGEEFMIYVHNADKNSLEKISDHLRSNIEKFEFKHVNHITASFGATMLNSDDNIETLIKRVDSALYRSKHSGRNMTTVL